MDLDISTLAQGIRAAIKDGVDPVTEPQRLESYLADHAGSSKPFLRRAVALATASQIFRNAWSAHLSGMVPPPNMDALSAWLTNQHGIDSSVGEIVTQVWLKELERNGYQANRATLSQIHSAESKRRLARVSGEINTDTSIESYSDRELAKQSNILDGWSRVDVLRYCKHGLDKPYLVTKLINLKKRQMMTDFVRLPDVEITDVAKSLPICDAIENFVHFNPNTSTGSDEKVFTDIGATDYEAAEELSYALDAMSYKAECPHCGSQSSFTCYNCNTTFCFDMSADYDPVCVNCGATHFRSDLNITNLYKLT